jgi:hypothetical protein
VQAVSCVGVRAIGDDQVILRVDYLIIVRKGAL